ncbi:hypothetical protein N0V83_010681 [Neocucurbitaria cava]|uniref:Uncharacterized protein n=1 Tax=Neocucurbitaria cava TaxID=798079 RepID=A0A9W8Y0J0_9PLEO|nr:hypothetical protein N0V83_010681 [Neocucurbitaria cava]
MYFKYTTVLASLLALSQTLWTPQAVPVTSLQPDEHSVSVRDNAISKVDHVHTYHTKRNPADPDMSTIMDTNENNLLKTWSGWIAEPVNSGWKPETIADFAILAHKYISVQTKEPWILAALWIRDEGVAFGSQARGNSLEDRTADQRLDALLPAHAPVLWQYVEFRIKYGSEIEPKWHAEDVAMWKAAKEMARKNKPIRGAKYPENGMVIYGKYRSREQANFVPPCKTGTFGNDNKLVPGCEEVLKDVGIEFFNFLI